MTGPSGRVIIVTGANSRIGLGIALGVPVVERGAGKNEDAGAKIAEN